VGIGVTSPQTTLDVSNGTVTANAFNALSDYRIKDLIRPLELEEYSIDKLKPVIFNYKSTNKTNIGVIAHELQEYYPFLVDGIKNGENIQSVNYIGLIGILIKEIQELKRSKDFIKLNPIEIDEINNYEEGMLYYNKNTKKITYFNGEKWIDI